jgi:hypothetical protein
MSDVRSEWYAYLGLQCFFVLVQLLLALLKSLFAFLNIVLHLDQALLFRFDLLLLCLDFLPRLLLLLLLDRVDGLNALASHR